ncbi:TonB-dependent receptor plug domain-containing protein [Marinobacter sp. SS21]|uniref:TonB-dependent receptor plug domain-containing protein n=1 Tax=Marinobacter sp. SS21 TaxID=2979460 RepID=UPI00232CFEA0|nr:TonB-dependent receptor [Marinobacter sp. SS21]MDC0663391.1 TonB-dependent receptor plug domain-containing protein [Marinobacter sp. SS21]
MSLLTPNIKKYLAAALLAPLSSVPAQVLADNLVAALDVSDAFAEDYGFLLEAPVPEVLTTTKLRQPKSRVPGTTTVIQGQLIRDLGILNLVEVFRLVPGMTVGYVGSNRPVTSYHGTVAYDQRRLQVLIDGRTAYLPSLSGVDWNTMPVALENIERIEISRGPNAAAYGINAFLGTINIITRSPEDTQGVNLHTSYGSRGHKNVFGSAGNVSDDFGWRLSYERRDEDGFDFQVNDDTLERETVHDGYSLNFFNYDARKTLSSVHSLDLRAGVTDGIDEEDKGRIGDEFGAITDPDVDVRDYYLQARWNYAPLENHYLHVQASYQNYDRHQKWRTCPPGFGFCADTNQNIEESRLELEIQDTLILNPDLRLVSGLGYREDRFNSDTFFNGNGSNYQSRLFSNVEYTPIQWLTFNVGANWEDSNTLDNEVISPRFAANFQLAENQTLRFVFSKAVRTPDAFEQGADWGYRATNVEPDALAFLEGMRVGPVFQAPGTLDEERIISREISYFGQFRVGDGLLSTEIKYFYDHLRDIISGHLSLGEWDLDNNVALDQKGFEVETSLEYPDTQLRLTYAYMDQDGEYTGEPVADEQEFIDLESRLTARHSGSAVWVQQYGFDISSALAYYFVDEFRRGQFERADLRLVKNVYTPRLNYDVAVIFQYYLHDIPPISRNNIIKDRNQVFLEAGLRF